MYIYVIGKDKRDSPVKIGTSTNPQGRLKVLQTANHEKLHIKHLVECKSVANASAMEREIHRKLDQYRVNGEWFSVEGLGRFRKICGSLELKLPRPTYCKGAYWRAK